MVKILTYFANNKIVVNILIIMIVVMGLVSIKNIKQDLYPQANLDAMIVIVTYPGAAPIDVENNAIIPIERKLKSISGIKKYTSMSMENMGRMVITIDETGGDTQEIKDEITRELQSVEDLAEEVESLKIIDANPDKVAVYEVGIYGKKGASVSEKELYDYIDALEKKLLKVNGVSDVENEGYREAEIKINVLPDRMNKYYISLNDIVNSVKTRNIRVSGGTLQSVHEDKSIVTIGQFENPLEVGEVIIRSNFASQRVLVKNIADVEEGFKKSQIEVKVNRRKGVTLAITKKPNSDVVSTVKNIKELLEKEKNVLPPGLEIVKISDKSMTITSLLEITVSNAIIGFILVFLILFIFLQDIGTAFWTAFGIPTILLITLFFMRAQGQTLNILTLGAMITVMGMLVDNGIVIAEIIFEKKSRGLNNLDASIQGVMEVLAPITIGVVTTIVAFVPMFSIKGMMGKFIKVFPVVIIVALLASLFEASILLPNHLAHMKVKHKEGKDWFDPVTRFYQKMLVKILKMRYLVILMFVVLFAVTIFFARDTIKNFVLLEDESSDQIFIKLEAPKGTSLENTTLFAADVEELVYQLVKQEELISCKTTIGHHTFFGLEHEGYHDNWALVGINLVPLSDRKRNADGIMEELRKKINPESLKNFNSVKIEKVAMGPPTGSAIELKVISNTFESASEVKETLKNKLAGIDGLINISDSAYEGKDELVLDLDYEKIAQLGLNVSTIASTIRTAYEGTVATFLQRADNKLDFRVKIDDSYQKDTAFLLDLLVSNTKGRLIRIGNIASLKSQKSTASIDHYNGERVVTVKADIKPGSEITSTKVMKLIAGDLQTINKKYKDLEVVFEGEASETKAAMSDLVLAFGVAVFMIYLVLILLFKNLSQPFIVMLTIPFGVIGAFLAFMAHGMPLSFMGVIGIIGLAGVVVNGSVVMVDFINKVCTETANSDSTQIKEKIAEGARQRLRPIVLTTLTTVCGLLPTAYGIGGRSDMLIPIVIPMAYGLLFATLLTLIFIPCLYCIRLDGLRTRQKILTFVTGFTTKTKKNNETTKIEPVKEVKKTKEAKDKKSKKKKK